MSETNHSAIGRERWGRGWTATLPENAFLETLVHLIAEPIPIGSRAADDLFLEDIKCLSLQYIQHNPAVRDNLLALSWAYSPPEALQNSTRNHFAYEEFRALVRQDHPQVKEQLAKFAEHVRQRDSFKLIQFSDSLPGPVSYVFRKRGSIKNKKQNATVGAIISTRRDRITEGRYIVVFDSGNINKIRVSKLHKPAFDYETLKRDSRDSNLGPSASVSIGDMPGDLKTLFTENSSGLNSYYSAMLPLLELGDVVISVPKSVRITDEDGHNERRVALGSQFILMQKGYLDFHGVHRRNKRGNSDRIKIDRRKLLGFSLLAPFIMNRALQHYVAVHLKNQRETEVFRKHSQMLRLLQSPLMRITGALHELERDTQELRGVLYDPAKALFASYPLLAPLFAEDRPFSASKHVQIKINHGGVYEDDPLDGEVVLAVALCRIFGRAGELETQRTKKGIIAHAKEIIRDCQENQSDSFGLLIDDLLWMLDVTKGRKVTSQSMQLCDVIGSGDACLHLATLKAVLFQPFKLETNLWDTRAIALAVRSRLDNEKMRYRERVGIKLETLNIQMEHNPCSYHSVLSFLTDICSAIGEQKTSKLHKTTNASVRNLQISSRNDNHTIAVSFSDNWLARDQVASLRELLNKHVFSDTRDWRIMETNTGNFRKPFVDLANRLLDASDSEGAKWKPFKTGDGKNCWVDLRNEEASRAFRVRVKLSVKHHPKLIMEWVATSKRAS